jgi:hypothetical protein
MGRLAVSLAAGVALVVRNFGAMPGITGEPITAGMQECQADIAALA